MRDIDNEIRASLERLTQPNASTTGTEALWGDLVDRRRKRRNRNRTLAALPLLLVAVLAVGVFSAQGSDETWTEVGAGNGDQAEAPDDFAPFEMTYRTLSYQGGEMVPATWKLTYQSWTDWEETLIDVGPSFTDGPGSRRVVNDGTFTEYDSDGTVRYEEPVDGRMAPLALMSQGPRTGKGEAGDSESTYRHEYTSTREHECPDDPADGAPYCEQAGGTVVVETVEAYNADGVPVFAEERIADSGRVVWQFETLTYERLGSSDDCASADSSRPSARCGGVYGPVMFGPEQHGVMEQARLAGQMLHDGDCLYLLQSDAGGYSAGLPMVWPNGTVWQDDPAGVRLADGTLVPVGAFITAAGGVHEIDRLTELGHAESVAGRARQCAGQVEAVAYVQGEIEIMSADQAPLDSSQGKGFVLKFLGHLRDGDVEGAATLWSGYPVSEPDRPISERVQYVEQLAEYPPFARIIASDTVTMFVMPSTANRGGHVITIMDPRSGDSPPVAVAFLTGLSGDDDDERWWIHRLPAIDAAAGAALSDDGYVEPGEQVVVPGLPVEGGVRGFVNSTEVPVKVDLENETFTIIVPPEASGDIAVTFVVSTPEEPLVRTFAATVR